MLDLLLLGWLSTPYENADVIWGLPIFWWARIGKILQFTSGLIIVVDIVGIEKVEKFGDTLSFAISLKKVKSLLSDLTLYFVNSIRTFIYDDDAAYQKYKLWNKRPVDIKHANTLFNASLTLSIITSIGLLIYALLFQTHFWYDIFKAILAAILFFLISVFVYPSIITFFLIIYYLVIAIIDLLFIEPFAYIMKLSAVEKQVKQISAVLFFLGFFIELLAS